MTRQIHHLLSETPPSTISQTNLTAKLNFESKMENRIVTNYFNLKHFSFQRYSKSRGIDNICSSYTELYPVLNQYTLSRYWTQSQQWMFYQQWGWEIHLIMKALHLYYVMIFILTVIFSFSSSCVYNFCRIKFSSSLWWRWYSSGECGGELCVMSDWYYYHTNSLLALHLLKLG